VKDALIILGIALAAFGLAAAFWFIRVKMDGRRLRAKMHQRRVEDERQREIFSPEHMSMRVGQFREEGK
jgi:hypothetical protein